MATDRTTVAELEGKFDAFVVQTDDQILKLMTRVAELETDLQDDGKLNQSYKVVNIAPKDTLYTKFSFFFTNTVYKLALVALVLFAAYQLLPIVGSFVGVQSRPPIIKEVIEVSQTDYDLIKEAFSIVVREVNNQSISDILEARDAIYANIPTRVSQQIVSKISLDLSLNELQGVLEKILSELQIKPEAFSLDVEPVIEEPVIEEAIIEPIEEAPITTTPAPQPAPNPQQRRFFR